MRFHVLLSLALLAASSQAFAVIPGVSPAVEKQLKFTSEFKTKKFVYDYAVGSNASSTVDSGVHGTGVFLPAGAVITRSWLYVNSQLVSSVGGTLAFHCEDANNIKTATNLATSAAAAIVEGQSTGAGSAFVGSIAAACEIKGTSTYALTAGKITGYVQYFVP